MFCGSALFYNGFLSFPYMLNALIIGLIVMFLTLFCHFYDIFIDIY